MHLFETDEYGLELMNMD